MLLDETPLRKKKRKPIGWTYFSNLKFTPKRHQVCALKFAIDRSDARAAETFLSDDATHENSLFVGVVSVINADFGLYSRH